MRRATEISAALLCGVCFVVVTTAPSCKSRGVRDPGAAGRGGAGAGAAGRGGAGAAGAGAAGHAGGGTGDTGEAGAWTQVPTTGPCALEVADLARVATVPLAWSTCGPGCTTTPAKIFATDDTVYEAMATARVEGDDVVLRLGSTSSSSYKMIAARRLSNGALLGAVRAAGPTTATCSMLSYAPSAPHVFAFGKDGTMVVGFLTAASLVWSPPLLEVPSQTSVFENDLGWGMGFSDGSLRTMFPPDKGALTTIDQGSTPSHSAVARGTLVISNLVLPGAQDQVIRAWEPALPSRTLVAQADTGIPSVALSDTALVWVGTHGPSRASGGYTAAELYWAASPAGKQTVAANQGTPLPATAGLLSLQTGGDHAAVIGTDQASRRVLFVVRLSDGKLWTIKPRPGAFYMKLLAVTRDAIVYGEIDDSGKPDLAWQIQRLTRYELTRLDDLATAW